MKKLKPYIVGMVLGSALVFAGTQYHVLRTSEGWEVVGRSNAPQLSTAYVDIRSWGAADWTEHPQITRALTTAGREQLIVDSSARQLADQVETSLGQAQTSLEQSSPQLGKARKVFDYVFQDEEGTQQPFGSSPLADRADSGDRLITRPFDRTPAASSSTASPSNRQSSGWSSAFGSLVSGGDESANEKQEEPTGTSRRLSIPDRADDGGWTLFGDDRPSSDRQRSTNDTPVLRSPSTTQRSTGGATPHRAIPLEDKLRELLPQADVWGESDPFGSETSQIEEGPVARQLFGTSTQLARKTEEAIGDPQRAIVSQLQQAIPTGLSQPVKKQSAASSTMSRTERIQQEIDALLQSTQQQRDVLQVAPF